MSTGCECRFYEIKRDSWIYVLENYNAPKNSWDWRDHATAYGPFDSFESAEQHLDDNHANPGGFSKIELPAGQDELDLSKDETLKRLVEDAVKPQRRRDYYPRRW